MLRCFKHLFVVFFLIGCSINQKPVQFQNYWTYISSDKNDPSNAGIGIYKWNSALGELSLVDTNYDTYRSSYLTVDKIDNRLYSVGQDGIHAFDINVENGSLSLINSIRLDREEPCYIALSSNRKYLLVAFYGSGEIGTYSLSETGKIEAEVSLVHHSGSSITKRQQSAHPHMIIPAFREGSVFVSDLGTDKVYMYSVNDLGLIDDKPKQIIDMPGGFGPRHLAMHPNMPLLYVLGELSNEIIVVEFYNSADSTKVIDKKSTLPASYTGSNSGADINISLDGRYLYSSNRGHNSIAVFEIDEKKGTLGLLNTLPSGGDWPRAFALTPDMQHIIIANKRSDNTATYDLSKLKRENEPTIISTVPSPQCIRFIATKNRLP